MPQSTTEKAKGPELQQLLRLHERLMREMQKVRDELVAPTTKRMVTRLHSETGANPEGMGPVTASVEEVIRAIKLSESALRLSMTQNHPDIKIEGIDNMPAALARFIAERSENPAFRYEVVHDENRGWIVAWKEYWGEQVRASGQFYERPYAWLDD